MAEGRQKPQTSSTVISVRVDEGVLEEIARILAFRYRTPISRETFVRMILYGDEAPVSPKVCSGALVRIDFRLADQSCDELMARVGENGNRSEYLREILLGHEPPLSMIEIVDQ